MYKVLAGVLFGAATSWIGMLLAISHYIIKSTEKDKLIIKLTEENNRYKKRLYKEQLDFYHSSDNKLIKEDKR